MSEDCGDYVDRGGNNGNDASAALDSGLQFKIPDDIPAGKYILSWTWINRIGNREFYMNCAPVTLTGTGGDKSNLDKLPEIFVTNSPSSNTCQTPEGSDYAYPNPGAVVFNKGNPSRLVKLTCPANTPGGQPGTQTAPSTGSGSGSGQGDKPADTEKPAGGDKPSTSPLPGNGVKAPAPGNNPVEQPAASSATPTATPTPKAPVSKPPVAPSAPSPSPATGNKGSGNSGSGNNEGASSGGACTPGQFKCVGGSAFQQCTAGQVWAAQIQMAAGTKCDSGAVTTSLYSLSKREVSFRA